MLNLLDIYHNDIPEFLREIMEVKELVRLKKVGMNCGLEYTGFSFFKDIDTYSRYEHSLGVALIIYHFTGDKKQCLAGLFHDISTPCFAHTVDFMYGDYTNQESTEEETTNFIKNSKEIMAYLNKHHLTVEDVNDYHLYPIADNDGYKLSSDRLEYSLGNMVNYGFADKEVVKKIYDDLVVGINEFNETELMFKNQGIATLFFDLVLQNSKVYISDEDRYSMEVLAGILREAINLNVITYDDLYTDEEVLLVKINSNKDLSKLWEAYKNLSEVKVVYKYKAGYLKVDAKKRYINPFVLNKGRLSDLDENINKKIKDFLAIDFNVWIKGE